MKVLVTGGCGFIGSHIVNRLLEDKYEVIVLDNLSAGKRENITDTVKVYTIDLRSPDVDELFKKENPEIVIHLAAQVDVNKSIQQPLEDADINILGTVNLLECAKRHDIKRFIFASSCAVYGDSSGEITGEEYKTNPISPYGLTKYTSERYIYIFNEIHQLPYTIFRFANIYGPKQNPTGEAGVIPIFIRRILSNQAVHIYGDGTQQREFLYVKDVAEAIIKAIEHGNDETYNLGTAHPITINHLLKELRSITNKRITAIHDEPRAGDIKSSRLNSEKAKEQLNWVPIYTLEEGLKETIHYFTKLDKG